MSSISNMIISENEQTMIAEAVRKAEVETGAEIVPYIVDRSDAYEEAEWRGGVTAGILVLILATLYWTIYIPWTPWGMPEIVLVSLLSGAGFAYLIHKVPSLERFFAGKVLLHLRVAQRASQTFLNEEVFKTKERTGVLIYVSLVEHVVIVLGDTGINSRVKEEEWDEIVDAVLSGMKKEKPAEGLQEAIFKAGELLRKKGVARSKNDLNELSDSPRIGGAQ